MTLELTGKQLDYISDALLAGIATADELRRCVRVSLDNDLDEIAMGDDLREITFKVVEWSDRHGCVGNLIEYAYSETPHNETSQRLYAFWHDLQSLPKSSLPPAEAAGALAPSAAVPPAAPQAPGRRRARVIVEGDDTTVVVDGSVPIRTSAIASQAQSPGLRSAARARGKLYLRLVAALLLAALVLLAFMLGRTFTHPQPAPAPAAAAPAPGRIGVLPVPISTLSAP
jgi:hypothetical protein